MGRKQMKESDKKGKLSITISKDNYDQLVGNGMNKSELINWLLEQHFNTVGNGK